MDKVRAKQKTYIWTSVWWKTKSQDEGSTPLTDTGLNGTIIVVNFYFIMNQDIHWVVSFLLSYTLRYVSFADVGIVCRVVLREPMHLCTYVSEEGDDRETVCSETPSLLSYTLRYVSFADVGSVCRVTLREPMHLCTCVSEEGDDGEDTSSETSSLMSETSSLMSIYSCLLSQ